ncbi:MAG: hypothetical protein COB02_14765 [Candidatus Cloacimonadota bacterium]|nr:MAG: hypothetical protein COB02_14765 [Candidatus Cloacimonadota bacterium]
MYKFLLLLGMILVCVGGFLSISADFVFCSTVEKSIKLVYGKKPKLGSAGLHFLEKKIQIQNIEAQTSKDRTRQIKIEKLSLRFSGFSIFSKNLVGKDLILDGVYLNLKLNSVADHQDEYKIENNILESSLLSLIPKAISVKKIILNNIHIRVVGENIDKQLQIDSLEWRGLFVTGGVSQLIQQVALQIQVGLDNEIVKRLKLQVADDLSTQFKNKFMDLLNSSRVKEGKKQLDEKSNLLKEKLLDVFNKTLSK